jgi:formate hydrogenlyase subunit 3/multisubunit Na+/H+ antiporter MnhD subunit
VNDRNHPDEHHGEHSRPPRWRRVHHNWIFWVAVFLMLLGIVTYVMTGDLFWALHRR